MSPLFAASCNNRHLVGPPHDEPEQDLKEPTSQEPELCCLGSDSLGSVGQSGENKAALSNHTLCLLVADGGLELTKWKIGLK